MIAANDLRIGNWVQLTDAWYKNHPQYYNEPKMQKVKTFNYDYLLKTHYINSYDLSDLEPIPLTEKILLDCGFEQRKSLSSIEYFIGTNEVTYDWLFSITWLNHPESINAPNAPFYRNGRHTIYFLHQLQNLYYALTQKELTITL